MPSVRSWRAILKPKVFSFRTTAQRGSAGAHIILQTVGKWRLGYLYIFENETAIHCPLRRRSPETKSLPSYAAKSEVTIVSLDASLLDAMRSPVTLFHQKHCNIPSQCKASFPGSLAPRAPHLQATQPPLSYLPPPLMTTRAPSFPKTPCSTGFGLLSLPLFRDKNPNIPVGFPLPVPMLSSPAFSGGIAALGLVRSDHEPVSPSTTCNPPPLEVLRVPPTGRGAEVGARGCEGAGK